MSTPCPSIPEHRCLDCAPPAQGRPFTVDGLSQGSPLGVIPGGRGAAPVSEHFERVELARGANRDGVVRIAEPARPNGPRAAARTARKQAKAARPAIPVIFGRS